MEQNAFRTDMHNRIEAYLELQKKQEEIIESLTEEDLNTLKKITQIHGMGEELSFLCKGMQEIVHESGFPFTDKEKAVSNFLFYKDIEGYKSNNDELPF